MTDKAGPRKTGSVAIVFASFQLITAPLTQRANFSIRTIVLEAGREIGPKQGAASQDCYWDRRSRYDAGLRLLNFERKLFLFVVWWIAARTRSGSDQNEL